MRLGSAVGVGGDRRAAGLRGPGQRRRPGPGRGEPQAAGRGPARLPPPDTRARAADEGHRGGLHRRGERVRGVLQRAAPGGLPRAGPRPGRPAQGAGRAAPDRPAGRGAAAGRDRPVRPRPVLRHVPEGLRAGVGPDGQGPGPAGEPAADRRRVRPADVLPEVRAPALPGLPQGRPAGGRGRHLTGRPGHGDRSQRPLRHGRGQAGRRRPGRALPQGQRVRVAEGVRVHARETGETRAT